MKITPQIVEKYLETLNDNTKDETYTTRHNLAKDGLEGFMNWLVSQNTVKLNVLMELTFTPKVEGEDISVLTDTCLAEALESFLGQVRVNQQITKGTNMHLSSMQMVIRNDKGEELP